jgi:hypothetical protein
MLCQHRPLGDAVIRPGDPVLSREGADDYALPPWSRLLLNQEMSLRTIEDGRYAAQKKPVPSVDSCLDPRVVPAVLPSRP